MIRAVQGMTHPLEQPLLNEMFQARRRLFKERLDWDVEVDEAGREIDEYDTPSALYLISVNDDGCHQGSLRLVPTTAETMLRDHFASVFDGMVIESPKIWECTRFCVEADPSSNLTRRGVQRVTTELLLGICETALQSDIEHIVGVFDARMIRIYRRGGWRPEVVGESGKGRDAIYLGVWDVSEENADAIRSAGSFAGSVLAPEVAGQRQRNPIRRPDVA